MPKEIPDVDNLEVAAYFTSARFIGGDFIRFLGSENKKRLGLLIGDVCVERCTRSAYYGSSILSFLKRNHL
jgi:serine phosphatase RsbU (regulator of sigma subunit)